MKQIKRTLKVVIPIAPFRMLIYILLSLPGAILPTVMCFFQQQIIDQASHLQPERSFFYYRKPVLCLIGTYLIWKLFYFIASQYMEFGYFQYVLIGLDNLIHKKSAQISFEYYDNAVYYQTVQNAKQASMFLVFTTNLAILSFLLIGNMLSVSGYLATLHPLLILFVGLISIPVIIEKVQGAKLQSNLMQDSIQAVRRKKYAFELLSTANRKKEIAHYGASHYIAEKYQAACKEITEKEQNYIWKVGRNRLGFAGIKALFHGIAIVIMIWLVTTKRITIGAFSVLLTSFSILTDAFTQICQYAGEILQTSTMAASFFTFMDLTIQDGTKQMENKEEIARLQNVSYQYQHTKERALKNISFSIKKGETIAIVGENGAGKTTLAKLLSGFLLPTEGKMELGGISREQLQEDSIFNLISAVYQEYGRYQLTVEQNIYLGDTKKPIDREKIKESFVWAGLSLSKYPIDTLLGKEFGGIDFSGGQWQRLALGRSYYRKRPILFLDEPTASIDPFEEREIYKKLKELAQKQTVVLVTHRLGAVQSADRILVLHQGSLIETGNFTQLIEQKGYFYQIWKEQARWYQDID